MVTAILCSITFLAATDQPAAVFVHRATTENTKGAATRLLEGGLGNKTDWVFAITQNWNPPGSAGVYNPHPIGIQRNADGWYVVNLDGAAIPAGASFNVLAVPPGQDAYVHTASASSISGNWTTIANSASNQNLIVTPFANGTTPAKPIGLWAPQSQWNIFTQDRSPMPIGAAYHVVNLAATKVNVSASNVAGHIFTTNAQAADPTALLFTTPVYSSAYLNSPTGVFFDSGAWKIFNQDRATMPTALAFNILSYSGAQAKAFSPNSGGATANNPTNLSTVLINPGALVDAANKGNLDFTGGLAGWTKTGAVFDNQPTIGDNVFAARIRFGNAVGGDYWNVPYPIGNNGKPWIGTFENHNEEGAPLGRTQGDAPQGTLTSWAITVSKPYLSFLIGGGNDLARLGVQLLVEENGEFRPSFFMASGLNTELMRREVFDLTSLRGKRIKILIRDLSSANFGHTNVADFKFHDADPRPNLAWANLTPGHRVQIDPETPVFGLADLHTHPAAHVGFGGNLYHGDPLKPMPEALTSCQTHHDKDPNDIHYGPAQGFFIGVGQFFSAIGQLVGIHLSGNLNAMRTAIYEVGGAMHGGVGYPALNAYRFDNKLHQHMHIDWIKRAYEGGLRLMVAHPVHNAFLADLDPKADKTKINDRVAADDQIAYIKRLVDANSTWMQIAYTSQEARQIIRDGKLCVVMGLEVDAIGDFRERDYRVDASGRVTQFSQLNTELDRLYSLGVRHIFPVHLTDSVFGGSALYDDFFNFNQFYYNYSLYRVEDGIPHGCYFALSPWEKTMIGSLPIAHYVNIDLNSSRRYINIGELANTFNIFNDSYRRFLGHVNARGLTDVGRQGIRKLMDLGMIIDVDHMSIKTLDEVLNMCEAREAGGVRGYPPASGHTGFRELNFRLGETLNPHHLAHESNKSRRNLERIFALGGVVAPITTMSDVKSAPNSPVANDAPGTSKSFAQALEYAISVSGGKNVAFGTDLALLGGVGPRFGTDAVPALVPGEHKRNADGSVDGYTGDEKNALAARRRDLASRQVNGVKYDSPIRDYRRYRFFSTNGNTDNPVYNERQRDFWEALAIWRSGTDPNQADMPGLTQNRSLNTAAVVKAFAEGLRASSSAQVTGRGAPFSYYAERRAAYLLKNPSEMGRDPGGAEEQAVLDIMNEVRTVWNLWQQMENASSTQAPMKRLVYSGAVAGRNPYVRDFDFNIDGFAHYGLLPDFMQDLANVGVPVAHRQVLFNSAEAYIQMWEKCEKLKANR